MKIRRSLFLVLLLFAPASADDRYGNTDTSRWYKNESPAGLAARADCDGKVKLDEPRSESGPNDIRVPLAAAELDMSGDPVQVPSTETLAPAVAPSAAVATAVPRPRLALTPKQELHNQRVRRYRAMKGLSPL
jgi:hypothetical protein